jgi:hypothetical protein
MGSVKGKSLDSWAIEGYIFRQRSVAEMSKKSRQNECRKGILFNVK